LGTNPTKPSPGNPCPSWSKSSILWFVGTVIILNYFQNSNGWILGQSEQLNFFFSFQMANLNTKLFRLVFNGCLITSLDWTC
jgi:hypothetical protein